MQKIVLYLVAIVVVVFTANYLYSKNKQDITNDNCLEETCVATTTATTTPVVEETQASTTKVVYDKTNELTYSYLDNFYSQNRITDFIRPVDWPPTLTVSTSTYVCKNMVDKNGIGSKTESKVIEGNRYCVTSESEGAAGSTYTTYSYKRLLEGKKTVTVSFVTRIPQCVNFDEPRQSDCKKEVAEFSVDTLVSSIFGSVKFDK